MALLRPSDDALEQRVRELCDRVVAAETATRTAFGELVRMQAQRYEDAVHFVYGNLVRGLMHGDRPRIQACLFAGCNTLEQLQNDWNTGRMEAQRGLLTAADDLRAVTGLLVERFGLALPVPSTEAPHPQPIDRMILDRVEDAVGRKRRRIDDLREGRERGTGPRGDLVDALRDPAAAFGTGLSAAEHRLLATILPECGLMPDLALMRDGWHPSLCLYSTDNDRRWSDAPTAGGPSNVNAPHVSTFCGLILTEFVRTRRDMQRFTFVHILTTMGFGPPDVNHYLPFVEQTFYDRVNSDTALCFIAEAHAPKMTVYRGSEWADLLDVYAAEHTGVQPGAWDGALRHHCVARLESRLAATIAGRRPVVGCPTLVPTTVLGALHRLRSENRAYLDGVGETAAVMAIEDGFRAALVSDGAGRPAIAAYLRGGVAHARAWPMALRQMAVEHVRSLVRRLRLLPRCPDLPVAAGVLPVTGVADTVEVVARISGWLWRFRWTPGRAADAGGGEADGMACDGELDVLLESELRTVVAANLCHPAVSVASLVAQACTEMDEAAIHKGVEAVYGPVTDANRKHMEDHLRNMECMVTEAFRHDRRLWTEDQRRQMGMDPIELVHEFRVAAGSDGPMFDPNDLRVRYMRTYRGRADDVALAVDADVTGVSAMRDPALFPPPADAGGDF